MMLLVAKTEKGSLYIQSKFIPADYRVGANYEKKYLKKRPVSLNLPLRTIVQKIGCLT